MKLRRDTVGAEWDRYVLTADACWDNYLEADIGLQLAKLQTNDPSERLIIERQITRLVQERAILEDKTRAARLNERMFDPPSQSTLDEARRIGDLIDAEIGAQKRAEAIFNFALDTAVLFNKVQPG
jgi:hypothetical protein